MSNREPFTSVGNPHEIEVFKDPCIFIKGFQQISKQITYYYDTGNGKDKVRLPAKTVVGFVMSLKVSCFWDSTMLSF